MRAGRRPFPALPCAAAFLCALAAALPLHARDWPARPLRLVMPVAAGGTPDIVGRALAQELSRSLGQPVLVENRPGAQTNIGMEAVASAAPDGYTLLFALTSLAINPHLQRLAFEPLRDFAPVAPVAKVQFVLMVSPGLPAASVQELIAHARSRPQGLSCGHGGGVTQLACGLFASLAKLPLVQVPYRSSPLIHNDLARGDVDMMFETLGLAMQSQRVVHGRPLAVTDPALGSEPLGKLPQLAGILPGFELTSWQGVVAPAATPAPIVHQLNAAIGAAIGAPEVARQIAQGGAEPMRQSPAEFGEFLRREHARYERIVREAGLRAAPG
jgi:tripartite-type tricarboxylate transporter receptor subunit TctC